MSDAECVLRFDGVSRLFGTVAAVQDIDLELRRGEILTLLGPSGCGKTTTLRMAIGLERASSGTITYGDRVVDSPAQRVYIAPENRDMGMVFQSYAIWPHMSVFENVAFPLRVRKLDNATVRSRVMEVLELVGLGGYDQRSGMALSGGQQQRVAVARGLVANPNVLLMDEPFSNLDALLREQMRIELKRLQRSIGFSVLFVTHDQSEALALSDRIAVMTNGRIEQIGSSTDLYEAPRTVVVRDFLGRSLKLPVRLTGDQSNGTRVSFADGRLFKIGGANHLTPDVPEGKCMIVVRPESVIVEPVGSAAPQENQLDARIRTLLFLGECYEADLELPGRHISLLRLTSARKWKEGETVRLTFPPESLQLWPRDY